MEDRPISDNDIRNRLVPIMDALHGLEDEPPEVGKAASSIIQNAFFRDYFNIPTLEAILSEAKRQRDEILATDIPCLLGEYGMASCTMLDGTTIGIDTFYETSQKDKDREALISWLEEHGYGSIVKDTLALDKGAFDEKLSAFLASGGYSYSRDSNVNGQTLKKTIKDHLLAGGEMPPEDALEVKQYNRAVVKAPKKQKGF